MLQDIMCFAPISSDVTECLHGYCQRLIRQTGGGSRPTDSSAQQRVLWGLITKSYNKMYNFMWDRFGDKRFLHRLGRFGARNAANQYSRDMEGEPRSKRPRQTLSVPKLDRLIAFDQQIKKPRKLSGSWI